LKKTLLFYVFLFSNVLLFAAAKDSLKAIEGQPVFSTIITTANDTIYCYVEYHDYFKEFVSLGKYNSLIFCYNPRFFYRQRLQISYAQIQSLHIGQDKYLRLLADKERTGILAKLEIDGATKVFHYLIDDFRDMKMRDSSYTSSLGFSVTKYDFVILQKKDNQFLVYDLTNSHRELTAIAITGNHSCIFHEEQIKLELSLLKQSCSIFDGNLFPVKYNLKEIKKMILATNSCK